MSTLRKLTIFLLIAAVLAVGMGFRAQPALAANCTQYYWVKWGDTLAGIARWYGVSWTYLAKINDIKNPGKIFAGQRLCVAKGSTSTGTKSGTFPTFSIVKVVEDEDVTIQTFNLPANDTFKVTMGEMGTKGVGGYSAGSFKSGNGGSKKFTFDIPSQLEGENRIAIRIQSSKSGFFAYNWFFNNTSSGSGTGGGTTPTKRFTGIPTFKITAVDASGPSQASSPMPSSFVKASFISDPSIWLAMRVAITAVLPSSQWIVQENLGVPPVAPTVKALAMASASSSSDLAPDPAGFGDGCLASAEGASNS